MSTSSSNSSTSSTCTCVLSYASSSNSTSEFKQYYFHPESNPDIKSKIVSFWKYLEQANITAPESNFSKFDKHSEEHFKEFKVKPKNKKDVKVKLSSSNKWCHLLRLMSKRGLDKLATRSKPKACRFCKYDSFTPTFADENCYDVLVEIEKSDEEKLAGFDDIAQKLKNIDEYLKSMYCDKSKENEAIEDETRIHSEKTETTSVELDELFNISKNSLKSASRVNKDVPEYTANEEMEEHDVSHKHELETKSNINADEMKEILTIHDIAEYVRRSHAVIHPYGIQEEDGIENVDKDTTIRIMLKIISENKQKKKKKTNTDLKVTHRTNNTQ